MVYGECEAIYSLMFIVFFWFNVYRLWYIVFLYDVYHLLCVVYALWFMV
jgi:hypothetical protein